MHGQATDKAAVSVSRRVWVCVNNNEDNDTVVQDDSERPLNFLPRSLEKPSLHLPGFALPAAAAAAA